MSIAYKNNKKDVFITHSPHPPCCLFPGTNSKGQNGRLLSPYAKPDPSRRPRQRTRALLLHQHQQGGRHGARCGRSPELLFMEEIMLMVRNLQQQVEEATSTSTERCSATATVGTNRAAALLKTDRRRNGAVRTIAVASESQRHCQS